VMSQNVMLHFEMQREKRLRQQAWNMNLCLATFVGLEQRLGRMKRGPNGEHAQNDPGTHPMPQKTERQDLHEFDHIGGQSSSRNRSVKGSDKGNTARSTVAENFKKLQRSQNSEAEEGDSQLKTFSRAAGLLGEALDLRNGGGVVFLDTFAAMGDDIGSCLSQPNGSVHAPTQREEQAFWVRDGPRNESRPQNDRKPSDTFPPLKGEAKEHAEVLASFHRPFAATEPPGDAISKSSPSCEAFVAPSPSVLADLIRRHPRGKLFNMDELPETTSEIMGQDYFDLRKSDIEEEHEAELSMLRDHFPTACQIIFIPVQNFASSVWSVCFCYNMSELRHFSSAFELPHSLAFCHCITTELGRLSILESSHHKSKFIGSISHELRSPLHGILASCDFMGEMGGSSFQRSMIDTASSCARTLMDTIDMVLDYSKINTFERDWRNVCKGGVGKPLKTTAGEGNPSMNIYSLVDIAKITEEVIEGSVMGSAVLNSSQSIIADTDHHRTLHQAGSDSGNVAQQAIPDNTEGVDVEMIVDIPLIDWTYVTQPGSFRRIVMNLVGNALKYTKEGFVQVQLNTTQQSQGAHAPDEDNPISLVTLSVIDSGCGISPEYLRTKLFTPFSQENSLAPGTGLGLSLVQSIVTMLDGEIDVKSQLNVGTQVTVQLPLRRYSTARQASATGEPDLYGHETSLETVRQKARGHRVAYFWQDDTVEPMQRKGRKAMRENLVRYLGNYFEESAVLNWTPQCEVSLIVVDESDLDALLNARCFSADDPSLPLTLVLCRCGLQQLWLRRHTPSDYIELLSKPIGPNKLAKSLCRCLDRTEALKGNAVDSTCPEIPSSPTESTTREGRRSKASQSSTGSRRADLKFRRSDTVVATGQNAVVEMAKGFLAAEKDNSYQSMQETDEFPFPATAKARSIDEPVNEETHQRPPVPNQQTHFQHEASKNTTPHVNPPKRKVSLKNAPNAQDSAENRTSPTSPTSLRTPCPHRVSFTHCPAPAPPAPPLPRPQRLLLVDDNAINLRLLQTSLSRRHDSPIVSIARDGQAAVAEFERALRSMTPPDIVFMDVSMPVMDGLEATRRIRELERECGVGAGWEEGSLVRGEDQGQGGGGGGGAGRGCGVAAAEAGAEAEEDWGGEERGDGEDGEVARDGEIRASASPSLVVALTGLASAGDRSAAFAAGVDMYVTKPGMSCVETLEERAVTGPPHEREVQAGVVSVQQQCSSMTEKGATTARPERWEGKLTLLTARQRRQIETIERMRKIIRYRRRLDRETKSAG
ncbi:MAG: hypothetical protein Q9165_005620, partial [Trypethelium subeluteriae]